MNTSTQETTVKIPTPTDTGEEDGEIPLKMQATSMEVDPTEERIAELPNLLTEDGLIPRKISMDTEVRTESLLEDTEISRRMSQEVS